MSSKGVKCPILKHRRGRARLCPKDYKISLESLKCPTLGHGRGIIRWYLRAHKMFSSTSILGKTTKR